MRLRPSFQCVPALTARHHKLTKSGLIGRFDIVKHRGHESTRCERGHGPEDQSHGDHRRRAALDGRNEYSRRAAIEEFMIGEVLMNRWALVNGYWWLYPSANSGPLQVGLGVLRTAVSHPSSKRLANSRCGRKPDSMGPSVRMFGRLDCKLAASRFWTPHWMPERLRKNASARKSLRNLVGPPGFEPGTSCTPSKEAGCCRSRPLAHDETACT